MRELFVYGISGLASLFLLGYSVHMLIGGLVSPAVERAAIGGAVLLGLIALGAMAWDISRRRR